MPSHALNQLSDDDVARLLGWIRTLPTSAFDVMGSSAVGVRGRFAILTGRLPDSVALATGQPKRRPADLGRYFAQASCAQCHTIGRDERTAASGNIAPALAEAVRTYDAAGLRTLVRTGKGRGNRSLPVMTEASRAGMAQLSDAEIDAIGAFLLTTGSQSARK